ncbi:hypothetical protein [Arthrobacter sp.]|uniref:hypothetical protein n=1 Tax=Arthrobacter sp. TaxID=1667 RepID=UPI003A9146F9
MWLMVPNAVVTELANLPGADVFRPRNGKYPVLSFNGVPILPWRVSKDQISSLEDTALHDALTGTKRALFKPRHVQTMFDFSGLDEVPPGGAESDTDDTANLHEMIHGLVGEDVHVAILAYASNQHALLSGFFGYAKLRDNDVVEYSYYEKLDLEGATSQQLHLIQDIDAADSFDGGDIEALDLRRRAPLEGIPSPERPIELPLTAEEDDDQV